MDTTQPIDQLIERLATLDPAETPGPAEEVADRLAAELEEVTPERPRS